MLIKDMSPGMIAKVFDEIVMTAPHRRGKPYYVILKEGTQLEVRDDQEVEPVANCWDSKIATLIIGVVNGSKKFVPIEDLERRDAVIVELQQALFKMGDRLKNLELGGHDPSILAQMKLGMEQEFRTRELLYDHLPEHMREGITSPRMTSYYLAFLILTAYHPDFSKKDQAD